MIIKDTSKCNKDTSTDNKLRMFAHNIFISADILLCMHSYCHDLYVFMHDMQRWEYTVVAPKTCTTGGSVLVYLLNVKDKTHVHEHRVTRTSDNASPSVTYEHKSAVHARHSSTDKNTELQTSSGACGLPFR